MSTISNQRFDCPKSSQVSAVYSRSHDSVLSMRANLPSFTEAGIMGLRSKHLVAVFLWREVQLRNGHRCPVMNSKNWTLSRIEKQMGQDFKASSPKCVPECLLSQTIPCNISPVLWHLEVRHVQPKSNESLAIVQSSFPHGISNADRHKLFCKRSALV